MKRSFYSALILVSISLFLILYGCKKDDAPTEPQNRLPKIESLTANPATVLISTETTLTCIATDEDGDNLTITWSAKRGTFSNGVVGVAVKWAAPSTAGKDTITATVNDGKQTIQGKLEIIVGTISTSPTLLTPSNNATEVALSPTLTWNAVSNSVSYTLQVSTSNSFSSFIYNQSGLTNTSQQISGLNANTTYYWCVNATNAYGTSGWSSVFSFKTVAPPQAPTLLSPLNNATEIELSPTLSWNAVSLAVSYTLQVSTSSSFSSFVYNQSGLTNNSQQLSSLNHTSTYYWRVSATNSYGTSGWSSVFSFKTVAPPQAPTLLTPTNNAIEIALSPTLTWNALSNAVSYTLQVSASNSFTSFVFNQNNLTNTSQQISGLNINTTYYWRVNAANLYGTSGWSTVYSFKTFAPPLSPTLTLPTNNAIEVSLSPTFTWNALNNATSYTLQVSTTNSFSSFVYNQNVGNSISQQISGLNIATTYYWRLNAINSYGTSSWSNIYSFKTVSPPLAPTLSSPIDGSGVSLSPTLNWNVSKTATSYTLQVSTKNDFSTLVINQNGLIDANQSISGLSNSTIYYWRVSATNSYGTSAFSNPWSFITLSVPCLGLPTIVYVGKTYNTIQIKTQCWLKENLDVGTIIQGDQNQTSGNGIEKYCYNNDPNNCTTYGGLYQWNEAMQSSRQEKAQGICPTGWHIPTKAELETLVATVNNNNDALIAIGQGSGTNTSGFSALLAGRNGYGNSSRFDKLGDYTYFWSSSESDATNSHYLYFNNGNNNFSFNDNNKEFGFSVRCLKD